MECERLKKLIRNWYVQVQDESMAPARMVDFMTNHARDCSTCMIDPIVEIEIQRITEIVLPPPKTPKAVREVKPADIPTDDDIASEDIETEDVDTEDDVDDVDNEDNDNDDDNDDDDDVVVDDIDVVIDGDDDEI